MLREHPVLRFRSCLGFTVFLWNFPETLVEFHTDLGAQWLGLRKDYRGDVCKIKHSY